MRPTENFSEHAYRSHGARRLALTVKLLFALTTREGVHIDRFAMEAGVSRRTVYRYLRALEDADVPWERDGSVLRTRPGWRVENLA